MTSNETLFQEIGNGIFPELRWDWVELALLASIVRDIAPIEERDFGLASDSLLRKITCDFILWAIENHGLKVGSMNEGWSKFIPWKSSPEESVKRIDEEWRAMTRFPMTGEIAWLTIDD